MTSLKQSNVERLAGLVIVSLVCVGAIALVNIIAAAVFDFPPRDSTDTATERSGMSLFVDHGTGCQYVGWARSALTPRLGEDGKQICRQARP